MSVISIRRKTLIRLKYLTATVSQNTKPSVFKI